MSSSNKFSQGDSRSIQRYTSIGLRDGAYIDNDKPDLEFVKYDDHIAKVEMLMREIKRLGPMHQPTCHPVAENVLPAEDIVIVRSHMPGRDAKWTWPRQRGDSLAATSSGGE